MALTFQTDGLGGSNGTASAQDTINISGAFVAGTCVVDGFVLSDTAQTVSSETDDTTGGPMAFASRGAKNGTGVRVEVWSTAINGGLAGGTYTSGLLSAAILAAGVMSSWSNVLALGNIVTASGSGADPSISLTTQDANNIVVAIFGSVGGTLSTSKTGTWRRSVSSGGGSPVVASLVDNTAAVAGVVTCAITLAAAQWAAVAFELRSVAPSGSIKLRKTLSGLGTAIGKRQLQW